MKAVVLIGGKGTRLRPITHTVPKALVPLRNKPYIEYLVGALRQAGLEGAVLSMGYLPDPIQQYLAAADLGGFSIEYVVEETPLGTGGGVKNAQPYLEPGPFVVTNGDILTRMDLGELIRVHRESGRLATLTLTSVEDPTAYGLVEVDHRLRVKRFVEKPNVDEIYTSLINGGIYVFEREVLEMIPPGKEVSIERDVVPKLIEGGELGAYISSAYWRDIGTPKSYLAASHDLLSGTVARDEGFLYTSIQGSNKILEEASLLPPLAVAGECEIEAGAVVGGRTSLGKRCVIEKGAIVEGSILFEDVIVGAGAIIRNSIIGAGTSVAGRCIVRGNSVLGAGCIVEEENVLDSGVRIAPGSRVQKGSLSF